jgi:hypothetical protein
VTGDAPGPGNGHGRGEHARQCSEARVVEAVGILERLAGDLGPLAGSISELESSVGQLGGAIGPLTGTTERIGRIVHRLPRSRRLSAHAEDAEPDPA